MLKVKVRGGGLMIWTRFAATGPERLVNIESTMSSSVYQSVLESNGPTAKAWVNFYHVLIYKTLELTQVRFLLCNHDCVNTIKTVDSVFCCSKSEIKYVLSIYFIRYFSQK